MPKFRPRIHNLAYHNGIVDFDIDTNAPGTAHWYHKRKGGRRGALSGGHGGCWRHGAPRWGADLPKFRPRIHNLAYHNGIVDFDIDTNAPGTAHWYHKRKGGRRRSLSGGHGGCWRHGAPRGGAQICQNSDHEFTIWPTTMALWTLTCDTNAPGTAHWYHKRKGGRRRSLSGGHGGCWRHGAPRWGADLPKFRPRIHNLAYHNGIMDFDIDTNAPGTAHWYHKRKGGRRRSLSGGHGGCWRHGAPRGGAQICQNSDHEFTIWPTTMAMALWTLTSISQRTRHCPLVPQKEGRAS